MKPLSRLRIAAVALIGLAWTPNPAAAQAGLALTVQPVRMSALLIPAQQFHSLSMNIALAAGPRRNHGVEGAVIGGVLFAAAGILIANGLCDSDSGVKDCTSGTVIAGLSAGTVGAVIGAFVGKTIPKHAKGDPAP